MEASQEEHCLRKKRQKQNKKPGIHNRENHSRDRTRYLRGPALLAAAALLFGACSDDDTGTTGPTIKFGLLLPFSGSLKTLGKSTRNAAELAAREINDGGGITIYDELEGEEVTKKIEFVYGNSKTDQSYAVDEAGEMAAEDIRGFIGPVSAQVAVGVFEQVADLEDLPVVITGTSPDFPELTDQSLVWRMLPDDRQQGKLAAQAAYNAYAAQHKDDKGEITDKDIVAAIIHVDNANGRTLAKSFEDEFRREDGGNPVYKYANTADIAPITYPEMSPADLQAYTFEKEAKAVTDIRPDIIFMAANTQDGIKLTAALRPLVTYGPLIFGTGFLANNTFLRNADAVVAQGMMGTLPGAARVGADDPGYKSYRTKYQSTFGGEPEHYSESGYDAVYLLTLAMVHADSDTKDIFLSPDHLMSVANNPGTQFTAEKFRQMVDALKKNGKVNYDGAAGEVEWDSDGFIAKGKMNIWKIEPQGGDLTFRFQSPISFDTATP